MSGHLLVLWMRGILADNNEPLEHLHGRREAIEGMGACRDKLAMRFGPTSEVAVTFTHVCDLMDNLSGLLSHYRDNAKYESLIPEINQAKTDFSTAVSDFAEAAHRLQRSIA
jgi:hypothetical protein